MIKVFSGYKFNYSYEQETGNILLIDIENKTETYLQGDDARKFRKQIEDIDSMDTESKVKFLKELIIKLYL